MASSSFCRGVRVCEAPPSKLAVAGSRARASRSTLASTFQICGATRLQVEGSSDKETLQVVHFLYDESTGSHQRGGRTGFAYPFGFLPGRIYSLDKQGRWEALAEIKQEAESFRRALTEEGGERPSPEETVVVLLEDNNNHRHSLRQVPFIRLKPNNSDEEEEEEYMYRQTRTGRAVEKKNKSRRRTSNEQQQDLIHKGDVIVYFWESCKKSKKQTLIHDFMCPCCAVQPPDRHHKKKLLMNEALR